ncbi:MAG: hypothetical protein ABI081_02775 [Burkholderiaceae bacterium]
MAPIIKLAGLLAAGMPEPKAATMRSATQEVITLPQVVKASDIALMWDM